MRVQSRGVPPSIAPTIDEMDYPLFELELATKQTVRPKRIPPPAPLLQCWPLTNVRGRVDSVVIVPGIR